MRFEDLLDKRITITALISCLAFIIYCLYRSLYFPIHDFSNSYFGAHFFLTGKFTTDVFDPYIFNRMIADEGHKNIFASYSPNPPFASIFFSSVAWLPVGGSKIVFNII